MREEKKRKEEKRKQETADGMNILSTILEQPCGVFYNLIHNTWFHTHTFCRLLTSHADPAGDARSMDKRDIHHDESQYESANIEMNILKERGSTIPDDCSGPRLLGATPPWGTCRYSQSFGCK